VRRPVLWGRVALAAGACLVVSMRTGSADPGDRTARTVTLADALASADVAPELSAARAGERAAEAAVRIARLLPDPEVSLTTNSVTARESVSVLLPLPWPARGPRIEAATADLKAAGWTRDSARASARLALRVAWFALATAEERAQAAAEREARARRNAEAIAALFAEGRVARLEQVRADAESALAGSEHASFEEELRTAGTALATLMGLDPGSALTTGGAHPLPTPEDPLEESVTRALEASWDVRLQAAVADAATSRWKLARRLRIPSLGLNLGADWNDPTQMGTNSFVGVSVAIPVAGSASTAAALGERDRQVALLERERRAAALAAESAWGRSRAARLRFEAIDKDLLPAARQAADLTRLAYQEGKVDVFRLLDAERLLSEAAVARADAYEAWGVAHADLLRATGRDEP
jgi:outer membrane protein, heavy metal efflux system